LTGGRFTDVFRWELRRVARLPMLWMVVSIVAAACIWGARNTAELHAEQSVAMAETRAARAAWYRDIESRIQRYRRPSPAPLKYWQDPTDVDGFSRYFLREHAIKPHLVLSPLSVGESALLPYILPVKLETPFGIDPAYDFRPPRTLALGHFDLGFAIVYLLPIATLLLVAMIGAFERDHGILRLAASQPVTPRVLLGARTAALSSLWIPCVSVTLAAALGVAGVPMTVAFSELLAALFLVCAYLALWLAIGFCVLLRQLGAAATAGILISVWAVFTLVVPVAASLSAGAATEPVRYVEYVNEVREVKDRTLYTSEWNDVIRRWLARQPGEAAGSVDPEKLTFAAHLVFITPEQERLLAPIREDLLSGGDALTSWSPVIGALSPPVALHRALSVIAGTDADRHRSFQRGVREYQLRLREMIYPLIRRQILDPRKTHCEGCAAKMVFTAYDDIPEFRIPDEQRDLRVTQALQLAAWFALLAGALICAGFTVGRSWRAGELD
jgi:ABC-2 type transport system permease protein